MWDFINVFYREYCLARLVEMRQLELKTVATIESEKPVMATVLAALAIAAVVRATIGPPPHHSTKPARVAIKQ
jgi:hypothetical protein